MFDKIKSYVDSEIINKKKIPYFDISVAKSGKEIFRYFNNASGNATGMEKLYMYSCSKVITATATMMLVEKGAISLDDCVSKYLPCFNDVYLIKDGVKVKPKNSISIKHLLTMTAGLDYNFERENIENAFIKNPNSTTLDIINEIVKSPLNFEPGEKFSYSLCHDVLGGVIEAVSGVRFSDFIEQNIFKPLGMNNSTFKCDSDGFEPLYYATNGKVIPFNFTEVRWANSPAYESGGGGLKSTVSDYQKFCSSLSIESSVLLKPTTIDLLTTIYSDNLSIKNSFTCVQGKEYGYGLGVRVRKEKSPCGIPAGEFGWDGAAGSYCLIDRENQISIVTGMHVRNWPNVFNGEHLKLAEMIYNELL